MVVDQWGRAYVGNYGFDFDTRQPFAPAAMILVMPDGDARVVADELAFPNGAVITPDGRTLIIAESWGSRLTAFDIETDGSLTCRRLWAQLEKAFPDGICLDADGAIWVASPLSTEVLRVREGGEVTHRISASARVFACMLGGPLRRTLFALTAEFTKPDEIRSKATGRVEMIEVEIPGAGLP
jgi:sugar lactone lactonase YvrE